MTKIKCLLVDDELPAVQLLKTYAGMINELEVVGTSHSAIKAFELLGEKNVDLLFLDIQMPVMNGIDFIKTLNSPPAIILTTAYREYALDGYDLDIIDYLLKPIPFDRFLKSVDRYRMRYSEESKESGDSGYVFFNVNRTQHRINIDEVIYLESLKDYTRIHLDEANLVVKGNIGTTLKTLSSTHFLRIHRSYAVAIKYILSFNKISINLKKHTLPIGASFKEQVFNKLRS